MLFINSSVALIICDKSCSLLATGLVGTLCTQGDFSFTLGDSFFTQGGCTHAPAIVSTASISGISDSISEGLWIPYWVGGSAVSKSGKGNESDSKERRLLRRFSAVQWVQCVYLLLTFSRFWKGYLIFCRKPGIAYALYVFEVQLMECLPWQCLSQSLAREVRQEADVNWKVPVLLSEVIEWARSLFQFRVRFPVRIRIQENPLRQSRLIVSALGAECGQEWRTFGYVHTYG